MSLYKVGDIAYLGDKEVTIARVIDNPMLPVYQYSFEPPHDGYACAAGSLSNSPGGPTHNMFDDEKQDGLDEDAFVQTKINTAAYVGKHIIKEEVLGVDVFFRPDIEFCTWLEDYANGRMVVDVGCGQGHLLNMLKRHTDLRVMGIEPNYDYVEAITLARAIGHSIPGPNDILGYTIQEAKAITQGLGGKALFVYARPCHTGFVEDGLDLLVAGQEALYITVPQNLKLFNDLGEYRDSAVKLNHRGTSEDNEVVYSIKK